MAIVLSGRGRIAIEIEKIIGRYEDGCGAGFVESHGIAVLLKLFRRM
jgi:hypothetical protein